MTRLLGIVGFALDAVLAPGATEAQQATRLPLVAYLNPSPNPLQDLFLQEMRRLGHVEGRTYVIEYRSADGDFARLPALAAELVQRGPDVVVAQVTQAAVAAKNATTSIPIVMIGVSDPVAPGWWQAWSGPAATSPAPRRWPPASSASSWNCCVN